MYGAQEQQQWIPVVQGKTKKAKEKKGSSNKLKIQAKAKKFLASRLGNPNKHIECSKKETADAVPRKSTPPFPYNGKDFGGSSSIKLCCLIPPPLPDSSDMPIHRVAAASNESRRSVDSGKPKHSSHYYFVKSLLEMNDFFSSECDAHRDDISVSRAK